MDGFSSIDTEKHTETVENKFIELNLFSVLLMCRVFEV